MVSNITDVFRLFQSAFAYQLENLEIFDNQESFSVAPLKMAKDKKRSHDEVGNTESPARSPKKAKDGHLSSPLHKNKSPKRDQRNGRDGKGSPAKGAVNESNVVEKSPRKKVNGHTVSGQDGTDAMLEYAKMVIANANAPARTDTTETKHSPKNQKKQHNTASLSKNHNADTANSEDLSALFSKHDRLLPGAKRTAMAQSYAASEPYLMPLNELMIDINTSLSQI